ncbi:MAG: FkbM family methyltransferase [Candidatus Gastranaerophilales bacterium]|nr:FkbM family methyltransferase [Candidatus Gastranaerophilales bacterium]
MDEKFVKKFWIFVLILLIALCYVGMNNMKNYAEKYKSQLEAAKSLLTDDYSREVFDELVAYNDSRTPMKEESIDKFHENYCPNVPLNKGDIMINGGISTDLTLTFKVAETVGEKGLIIGFDPNVRIIEQIEKEVAESGFKNIKTYPYGLWNKNCHKDLYFQDDTDASLIFRKSEGLYLPATLVKLDDFVVKENIPVVNFITLDVEGAEMQALQGSETILLKDKPNLAISIHHRPTDAFEIINYLNGLNVGYKFWLGYHGPYSDKTVNVLLYATAK